MKVLLACLAAASALISAPAMAQDEAPPPPPVSGELMNIPTIDLIHDREGRDGARIQAAVDDGDLAPGEAHRVREELTNIRTQEAELAQRDGPALNATDRQFINDRLNQLGHTIHWMRAQSADW